MSAAIRRWEKRNWKRHIEECYFRQLKKRYNLTSEQYHLMLIKQLFKCAICGYVHYDKKGRKGRLCVDHNHKTKQVRRLVCNPCNLILGRIEALRDSGKLAIMLAYLKEFDNGSSPKAKRTSA